MEGDAKGRTRTVTSLTYMPGSAGPKLEVVTPRGVIHLVKSQLTVYAGIRDFYLDRGEACRWK